MDDRIATGLWVEAKLRELDQRAISYYIVNKGAYFSGAVILKINGLQNNCRLLAQIRNDMDKLDWSDILSEEVIPEKNADEYLAKAISRDPDLWVIEIEERTLKNAFQ